MDFTDITNPFNSSNIPNDMPFEFWEWIKQLDMKSRHHEKRLKELEENNNILQERIEDLENEKHNLERYVYNLDHKVRFNEEETSIQLEKQIATIQHIFTKQTKSDETIRCSQEVIERLLLSVSKIERTISELANNFTINQDSHYQTIWSIQDKLDEMRENMRTEISEKKIYDNTNIEEL